MVEDDPQVRAALASFLTVLAVAVRSFASAEEFLAAYDADWTGCAIVDRHLPGLQGEELVEELQRRRSRLIAVLMTGEPDEQVRRRGQAAGAVCILEKPFRARLVTDLLKRHCPELFPA